MSMFRARVGRLLEPCVAALAHVGGGPPHGLRRGEGASPADVPVLVVHVRAGAEEAPEAILRPVTAARRRGERFTPVLLLERPLLAPFRRAGYVVELVGPQGVRSAVAEAVLTYSAAAVVEVALSDVDDSRALEARLLAAVPATPTGPVAAVRRLARRLERVLP